MEKGYGIADAHGILFEQEAFRICILQFHARTLQRMRHYVHSCENLLAGSVRCAYLRGAVLFRNMECPTVAIKGEVSALPETRRAGDNRCSYSGRRDAA
jgi:hypothetical protein